MQRASHETERVERELQLETGKANGINCYKRIQSKCPKQREYEEWRNTWPRAVRELRIDLSHWALKGSELTLIKNDICAVKLIQDQSLANQLRTEYELKFPPTRIEEDQIRKL